MSRKNGTWSPTYAQAWGHAKTKRAVAHAIERGIRAESAPFLVLGWLNRINCWCLSTEESGRTAGLSDTSLAAVAWPEAIDTGRHPAKAGAIVRGALRAGGFLEGGPDDEHVHEFESYHRSVLWDRKRKRAGGDSAEGSVESSVEGSVERSVEPSVDTVPERTGPERTGSENHTGAARGKARERSPIEEAARHLAGALGSSINPCRKQVQALAHIGWGIPRIEEAITKHAEPGVAPWDWTKRARGSTEGRARSTGIAVIQGWAEEAKAREEGRAVS